MTKLRIMVTVIVIGIVSLIPVFMDGSIVEDTEFDIGAIALAMLSFSSLNYLSIIH